MERWNAQESTRSCFRQTPLSISSASCTRASSVEMINFRHWVEAALTGRNPIQLLEIDCYEV